MCSRQSVLFFPPSLSGFLEEVCARKGSLCLARIRPPTFHSPKQGGRDASSLGNLCIQRGSGKETSGRFCCLMEITWHLSKRAVPKGSLVQQAVIKENLCDNLLVSCSQVFKHTKFCVQARLLSGVIKVLIKCKQQ